MFKFKDNKITIILYLVPALILYLGLEIFPLLSAVILSLFDWKGIGGTQFLFCGFENYKRMFIDPVFWLSVKNLVHFLVVSIITQLPIALLLAYIISIGLKGSRFFKLTFFLPAILSITAVSLMWKMILSTNFGFVNSFLEVIGLKCLTRSWLTDPDISFTVIALINSWLQTGFMFVILLAGIISIPAEIYEASEIDGANTFHKIFKILIPMIWNIIGVCTVLIITNTMKTFDLPYVLTGGSFGPGDVNQVPAGYMYINSFIGDKFGIGSAVAVFIMITSAVISFFAYLNIFRSKEIVR
jgi:raffinose/stachyose/melibiose transport system permease protein